jgi:hypothetical protein
MTRREKADAFLLAYEEANADLSPQLRRLLGLFALAAARILPREELTAAYLPGPTSILWRDVSRRWWLILSTSGAAKHWKRFKTLAEQDGVSEAWRWLRARVGKKRYALLKTRAGTLPWRATKANLLTQRKADGRTYAVHQQTCWFKGGTWRKMSPLTRLVVEGKTLEPRTYTMRWQRTLRPHVRLLEHECRRVVDLDRMTVPEAKWALVAYVQRRISELVGRTMSLGVAAWFLQVPVPLREGEMVMPRDSRRRGAYAGRHVQLRSARAERRKWT